MNNPTIELKITTTREAAENIAKYLRGIGGAFSEIPDQIRSQLKALEPEHDKVFIRSTRGWYLELEKGITDNIEEAHPYDREFAIGHCSNGSLCHIEEIPEAQRSTFIASQKAEPEEITMKELVSILTSVSGTLTSVLARLAALEGAVGK